MSTNERSERNSRHMQASGMTCPVCKGFIPVSIQQLLYENGISCPQCGQSYIINRMKSRQALDALRKVDAAARNLREKEHFKL